VTDGSSAPGSPTGTPVLTSAASAAAPAGATQHVDAGLLALEGPAGWHVRRGLPNPGGNFAFAYVSPAPIPSDCRETSGGGVCQSWPFFRLDPGGIVVAVRLYGRPGSRSPVGGNPITVAGLPDRRISGSADAACRGIGGSQSIDVELPSVPDTSGWSSIDACVAGGDSMGVDLVAADNAFDAIVASATLAGPDTSP